MVSLMSRGRRWTQLLERIPELLKPSLELCSEIAQCMTVKYDVIRRIKFWLIAERARYTLT